MDMRRAAFTVTANGSYAARLALDGGTGGWFPERWTLDGPEPYAVPLPGSQPEEPDSEVQPLADGRVLIRRRVAERHTLSLLYPTGPGTGELAVGAVECARLTLLPPAPGGSVAYGLVHAERTTALWRLHGGSFGPERVVEVPGRCAGGAWLDRAGRLLALDRELDGRTKTVVVDLERGGETSPLLQITEESNDRLLLADPYSGLLLVRSDAPGQDRLGWGVLGSARPVRFPECLRPAGAALTPFAAQPGQELTPEGCAVAFRVEGATGSWVGVWRPAGKQLQQFPAPAGWLVGAGLWTSGGELRLPFVTPYVRCGLARLRLPEGERGETRDTGGRGAARDAAPGGPRTAPGQAPRPPLEQVQQPLPPHMPPSGPQLRTGSAPTGDQQPQTPPPPPPAAPAPAPVQQRTQQPLLQVPRPAPEQTPAGPQRPQQPLLQGVPRPAPEPAPATGPVPLLQEAPRPAPEQPQPQPLLREPSRPAEPPAPVAPHQSQPLLQEVRASVPRPVRRVPEPGAAGGPQVQVPLLHESSRAAEPVRSAAESGFAGGPQVQAPLLQEAPRSVPEREPSAASQRVAQPLLHEVPRAASPQTPLLQEVRPAGPQPVRSAAESGFAAGSQVQAPSLHETPRAAEPSVPAAPEPVRRVPEPGAAGGPQVQVQVPLLHEVPRAAGQPAPVMPSAPQGLLQEVRSTGPEPSSLHEVARPAEQPGSVASRQPQPLLQELPTPGPPPARVQVPLLQEVPPPQAQPAPAARPQQSLLHQVPCPPQASPPESPPLLERPHEGPPPCPPPQAERGESPASVWTAVPPTGLPGAGMPGAWSVAASGGAPSRPVPLQQAPLGRESRP
ncbi:hypothetical protein [Streptomyces rectiverticillatus]|uniref:hypothetical protein n=1 Tax=Streptomyces rectiverticillatus TaxID=173860 RepID=UPI0031B5E429